MLPCYACMEGFERQKRQIMAKLGSFEFPEVGLVDSVVLARRIHEDLGGEVRRDALAMVLDMSPTGGAYGARIGALRMWGLATGRSVIRLTGDGVRAVSARGDGEEMEMMRKLSRSVPLFNELEARIGDGKVEQRVLAVMLQEITSAEMGEVMRRLPMVERIYGAIRSFLEGFSDEVWDADAGDVADAQRQDGGVTEVSALPRGWLEFRYDDGTLRLRETPENLDVLIGVLESRKWLVGGG